MTKIGQKLTDDIFCVCVWYTVVVNSGFDFFWGSTKNANHCRVSTEADEPCQKANQLCIK